MRLNDNEWRQKMYVVIIILLLQMTVWLLWACIQRKKKYNKMCFKNLSHNTPMVFYFYFFKKKKKQNGRKVSRIIFFNHFPLNLRGKKNFFQSLSIMLNIKLKRKKKVYFFGFFSRPCIILKVHFWGGW